MRRSALCRILALEARLADVEGGYGDTLYKLHRGSGCVFARVFARVTDAGVSVRG